MHEKNTLQNPTLARFIYIEFFCLFFNLLIYLSIPWIYTEGTDLTLMRYLQVLITGCSDQIVRSVNLILLPKQKTCRICKDSFGIASNRATKYVFS